MTKGLANLQAVADDIGMLERTVTAGTRVGSDTIANASVARVLFMGSRGAVPGPFNAVNNTVVGSLIQRIYGNSQQKIEAILFEAMRDPQALAILTADVSPASLRGMLEWAAARGLVQATAASLTREARQLPAGPTR